MEREEGVSWGRLRVEVVNAVECEVQGSLQEYELLGQEVISANLGLASGVVPAGGGQHSGEEVAALNGSRLWYGGQCASSTRPW